MDNNYYLKYFAQYKGRNDKKDEFLRIVDDHLNNEPHNIDELKIINEAFKESIKMNRQELQALGLLYE
jgi:predicted small metal-binding protein